MATQSTIESSILFPAPNIGRLTLEFSNGKSLDIQTNQLSADILLQATLHGLKQKLVDAAAISRNTDTGRSATVDDKFEAVREVHARLMAGQWNKVRAAGEGSSGGGLLLRAIMQLQGKDRETVKAWLDGKTDAERAALRKNPKVAAVILTLKPEPKADASIDSDSLLGELGA